MLVSLLRREAGEKLSYFAKLRKVSLARKNSLRQHDDEKPWGKPGSERRSSYYSILLVKYLSLKDYLYKYSNHTEP